MQIEVIAHPNSKRPRIEEDLLGNLHVYVSQPPLEGKANHAIVEALAKHLGVKRNQVYQVSGEKTKQKVFRIG